MQPSATGIVAGPFVIVLGDTGQRISGHAVSLAIRRDAPAAAEAG